MQPTQLLEIAPVFEIHIPKKRIIALDADGVLLNYNRAAYHVWTRAFGEEPAVKDPGAYHFRNAYEIDLSDPAVSSQYYRMFAKTGWSSMEALPHAVEGCLMLKDMGYELHVVSSMPNAFEKQRHSNLLDLGMPIVSVTATGRGKGGGNPKMEALLAMEPVAFVDDLLSNFEGVHHKMHCALLHWDSVDNPNEAHEHGMKASTHPDMMHFAQYWEQHALHQTPKAESFSPLNP